MYYLYTGNTRPNSLTAWLDFLFYREPVSWIREIGDGEAGKRKGWRGKRGEKRHITNNKVSSQLLISGFDVLMLKRKHIDSIYLCVCSLWCWTLSTVRHNIVKLACTYVFNQLLRPLPLTSRIRSSDSFYTHEILCQWEDDAKKCLQLVNSPILTEKEAQSIKLTSFIWCM